MSLERFSNKEEILSKDGVVRGLVWREIDQPLLQLDEANVAPVETPTIELHAYTRDVGDYIVGGPISTYQIVDTQLNIDYATAMDTFGVRRGDFEVVVNIHNNVLGSADFPMVFIREISGDRRELILRHVPVDNPAEHEGMIDAYLTTYGVGLDSFLSLNFGDNRIFKIINQKAWLQQDEFVVRLYEPLPDDIELNDKAWIVQEVAESFIDNIILSENVSEPEPTILRGANFAIDPGYTTITETEFKTWNDLLGSNLSTSQQILDAYFSGSLTGIDLGIDYTAFDNFVFYSSARDRLDNFKYKLELIEHYSGSIVTLQNASGSDSGSFIGSIASNQQKIDNLVGSFDSWERWLYNEPTSSITSFGISGSTVGADPYHIDPWPKYIKNGRYVNHKTTSTLGTNWYNNLTGTADLYDDLNESALAKTIPEHIRNDENNTEYELFVNMIGHHFDILYTYINKLTETYKPEEHPKLGVSRETLYNVAESLGWKLANGKQASALWQYKLGTDATGSYSQTGTLFSKADEDITTEVWRRIVNNLPYLLKTKGTARSVKALMNTYGIPQTLLSIREYGGPKVSGDVPTLIEDRFSYALQLNEDAHIRVASTSSLDPIITREIRFKPAVKQDMLLMSAYDGDESRTTFQVGVLYTGSYSGSDVYGQIAIANSSKVIPSKYVPLYDGEFWNLRWVSGSTNTVTVQKASDYISDKIIHKASATDVSQLIGTSAGSRIFIGGTGSLESSGVRLATAADGDLSHFSGSIQEYREWTEEITDATFDLHTKNPTSYVASTDATASYTTLVRHYPFGTDLDAIDYSTNGTKVRSKHPRTGSIDNYVDAFAYGFTAPENAERGNFEPVEETYYVQGISLGGNNPRSQKIRLEDNELIRRLSPTNTAERSSFDTAPLDSNKLGLFYSHADQINKDIFNHLGDVELDDYMGDPQDEFEQYYPELRYFSKEYWKKYSDRNDVNAYIRIFSQFDFSLFNQIRQLLPERVDEAMGLLIEPHALERSKVQVTRRPTITNPQYEALVPEPTPTASGVYQLHEGTVDDIAPVLTGEELEYNGTIESTIDGPADYCTVEIIPVGEETSNRTFPSNNPIAFHIDEGAPFEWLREGITYDQLVNPDDGSNYAAIIASINGPRSFRPIVVNYNYLSHEYDTIQTITVTEGHSLTALVSSGAPTMTVKNVRLQARNKTSGIYYDITHPLETVVGPFINGSNVNDVTFTFENVRIPHNSEIRLITKHEFDPDGNILTDIRLQTQTVNTKLHKVCRIADHAILDNCRPSYQFKQVVNYFSGSGTGTYAFQNAQHAVSQSLGLYYSQSLIPACYMDDFFAQTETRNYTGCKITGPGINQNTFIAALNNKPVVEVYETNANQLIFNADPEPAVPTTQNTSTPALPPGNITVR